MTKFAEENSQESRAVCQAALEAENKHLPSNNSTIYIRSKVLFLAGAGDKPRGPLSHMLGKYYTTTLHASELKNSF